MHEGSIAAALVQSVLEVREKEGFSSVKAVTVCIGRLHHVVPSLLQSAYRILKNETPALARSRLAIEILPVLVTCRACGRVTEIDKPEFACSACGSTQIDVTGGREMHLKEIVGVKKKNSVSDSASVSKKRQRQK
jgi:hydrogenase nickel incorporation protein HypA/HybF